ncbi:MAG TPA: ATP-binding protein, partial [Gemmatimonadales bacterium]|nr:ATP-binding protein [Gemmatimonadales bacterium]
LALTVAGDGGAVTAVVRDDARPFDPRQAPPPDLEASLEARRVGGLGWYLVRKLMHEIRHRALDPGNEVTLVRRFDGGRPESRT